MPQPRARSNAVFNWTEEAFARLRELWLSRRHSQRDVAGILNREFGGTLSHGNVSYYLIKLGLNHIKPETDAYHGNRGALLVLSEEMLTESRQMWAGGMPTERLIKALQERYPKELAGRDRVTIRRRLQACGAIQKGVHFKSRTRSRAEVAAEMPEPVVIRQKQRRNHNQAVRSTSFRGSLRVMPNLEMALEEMLSPRIRLRAEIMRQMLEADPAARPSCADLDAREHELMASRIAHLPQRRKPIPALPDEEAA